MADIKDIYIELKQLDGLENFNLEQIREVLQISIDWFIHFQNIASGNRKVKCNFPIRNFSLQEYDLSTSVDVENKLVVIGEKDTVPNSSQPYVFLSDLLNFVEEIRHSITSNRNIHKISDANLSELRSLGDMFDMIGITPRDQKITLKELQKIENEQLVDVITTRIRKIRSLLATSIEFTEETSEKSTTEPTPEKIEPTSSASSSGGGSTFLPVGSGGNTASDQGGGPEPESNQTDDKNDRRDQPPERNPDQLSSPLKLSELDPQTKLYLQSLSIITINQALNRYFNDAALQELGLQPGTHIAFDQLPLGIRQQLMDRAFLQVETLLRSGKFDLQDLIKQPGSRVGFTSETSLNLLIDVYGMRLMNQAVTSLVQLDSSGKANQQQVAEQLANNQNQHLTKDQLSERTRENREANNITDSVSASAFITRASTFSELEQAIKNGIVIISSERQLDEYFWDNLRDLVDQPKDRQDRFLKERIINNARSLIEVLIEQGIPPESFISNPQQFSYTNFKRMFGNDISDKKFEQHKEALAILIIYYWKQKRAIWQREIRPEYGQEKYTIDEANRKAKELHDKQEATRKAYFGLSKAGAQGLSGGRQVAEALQNPDLAKGNSILSDYIQQQQQLIAQQIEQEISTKREDELQRTLKAFFDYYKPGHVTVVYSVDVFRREILPQINPMDYYMIAGNEEMRQPVFQQNGDGILQRAFHSQREGGDDLLNNQFTRKGLEWAIRAGAAAATSGGSEALFKALDTSPVGQIIKEKVTSEIIEWVRDNWKLITAGMLLSWLASLLQLLLPFLLAYGAYLGVKALIGRVPLVKDLLGIETAQTLGKEAQAIFGGRATDARVLGEGNIFTQQAVNSATELTKGISALATRSVLVTVGGTALFITLYQMNLNLAFLTHFPYDEDPGLEEVSRESKYAEISKTARIIDGCISLENNGTKCQDPSFPVSIEYTITIKPKEDFTLQITDITDTVKFKASEKGWEEAGQTPPDIEETVVFDFAYFSEVITSQGGVGSTPINATPTPLPGEEATYGPSPTGSTNAIIIPAGSSLTFKYFIKDLNSNYNHTAIINTIEVDFYYENSLISGTDKVITAARVCLGECSGDVGCWPADGNLSQMPFGDYSHGPPSTLSYLDAYDIGSSGRPRETYVTYPGELCFQGCESEYGCHYILNFDDAGTPRRLLYAHFEVPMQGLDRPTACKMVSEGDYITMTGKGGNSNGIHLHYEADFNGKFYSPSARNFSIVETLVPETDQGKYPPILGNTVSTCYD